MHRLLTLGALSVLLVVTATGCGGSSALDNTESVVFLTVEILEFDPEVNVCLVTGDLTVARMMITSAPKDPDAQLTPNQDVTLTRWEITPVRIDGGTVTSPAWAVDSSVYVSAGGTSQLDNYRVYPAEYLDDPPFNYLFPENGGVDAETGQPVIREDMTVILYGRTVSGKAVATEPVTLNFRFTCN